MTQAAPPITELIQFIDPFVDLHPDPLELAFPETMFDAYTWVCYLANGKRLAEYDAQIPAHTMTVVDRAGVVAVDLLPVGLKCPEHAGLHADCSMCRVAFQRGNLRQHRLMVPAGGVAVVERRRFIHETTKQQMTWTVLGWEKTIIDDKRDPNEKVIDLGRRAQKVAFYMFLDDFGRSFSTSEYGGI